jgi:uncharacterized integral membrane protein
MYSTTEFESINRGFMEAQNKRKNKLIKIWGSLLVLTVIIILLLIFIFPNQFESEDKAWILPVYGGIACLITLIGFLVALSYVSEKPYFEYLFPKVVQKINLTEGLYLEYEANPKTGKQFNIDGGLFTRHGNVKTRRALNGFTRDQQKFNIYDCMISTSSGDSKQTHFDGNYIILHRQMNTSIQIRSNGSPKHKNTTYSKQENVSSLRVYKKAFDKINSDDRLLILFMEKLFNSKEYKRIYLNTTNEEIHLALWYKKHPIRKRSALNLEILNEYVQRFLDEYDLCNRIDHLEV